jgi:hypothetical protein
MIFLNHLRLRDNWLLLIVGLILLLTIGCWQYSRMLPFVLWDSDTTVIYPLLIVTNIIVSLSPLILLFILVISRIWHKQQSTGLWRNLVFCFALFASGMACYAWLGLGVFGDNISHEQIVEFKGSIYHLAKAGVWDPPIHYYVVYQCNDVGILCQHIYTSSFFEADITPLTLYVDPQINQLYLQIDNERFLVTP